MSRGEVTGEVRSPWIERRGEGKKVEKNVSEDVSWKRRGKRTTTREVKKVALVRAEMESWTRGERHSVVHGKGGERKGGEKKEWARKHLGKEIHEAKSGKSYK